MVKSTKDTKNYSKMALVLPSKSFFSLGALKTAIVQQKFFTQFYNLQLSKHGTENKTENYLGKSFNSASFTGNFTDK